MILGPTTQKAPFDPDVLVAYQITSENALAPVTYGTMWIPLSIDILQSCGKLWVSSTNMAGQDSCPLNVAIMCYQDSNIEALTNNVAKHIEFYEGWRNDLRQAMFLFRGPDEKGSATQHC